MENIKVSVIVPIYNGEDFLEKNLLILSRQTLKEIEFILVNDGSTDNSLNILKAFKNVFPDRFVVINSEKNRGPGGARNIGISYSRGKYIGFMDQDDYCCPDMFKALYEEAASDDYDIVAAGYYNKGSNSYKYPLKIRGKVKDNERLKLCSHSLFIWNKIFKKDLIEKMSMLFRENTANDDVDFCIEALLRAEKVSYIEECCYYYNYNGESLSRPKKYNVDNIVNYTQGLFEGIKKRVDALQKTELLPNICMYIAIENSMNLLCFLFSKEKFTYYDFLLFDKITKIILPEYYKIKKNDKDISSIIYNVLESDRKKSYENLIILKKKIQSGEFDKEINERKDTD